MNQSLIAGAAALLIASAAGPAVADSSVQRACAAKTRATYGFQCHGWAAVSPAGLEPATFGGVVSGNSSGIFEGTGVLNSSLGRVKQRFAGQALYSDRACSGSIAYRVWLVLPDGSDGPELPPLYVDFATVKGGEEILGVPSNPTPGASGAAVPRLNCRLVKTND